MKSDETTPLCSIYHTVIYNMTRIQNKHGSQIPHNVIFLKGVYRILLLRLFYLFYRISYGIFYYFTHKSFLPLTSDLPLTIFYLLIKVKSMFNRRHLIENLLSTLFIGTRLLETLRFDFLKKNLWPILFMKNWFHVDETETLSYPMLLNWIATSLM